MLFLRLYKKQNMGISTFIVLTIVTIFLALLIRAFWIEILIIWYTICIIGSLALCSLFVAAFWAGFVSGTSQGFGLLWLYLFILFSTMAIVYALIVMDIANMAIDFIRNIFKI